MEHFKTFITKEDINEWVKHNYSADFLREIYALYFKSYSPLGDYKGGAYQAFNQAARENKKQYKEVQDLQAFLQSYDIQDNIKVYRFVNLKELCILCKNTLFRKEYIYPQFLSTTLSKKLFAMYTICSGRIAISINIPKGTKGVYLPDINTQRPEYEILLPHHTKLIRTGFLKFQVVND